MGEGNTTDGYYVGVRPLLRRDLSVASSISARCQDRKGKSEAEEKKNDHCFDLTRVEAAVLP